MFIKKKLKLEAVDCNYFVKAFIDYRWVSIELIKVYGEENERFSDIKIFREPRYF